MKPLPRTLQAIGLTLILGLLTHPAPGWSATDTPGEISTAPPLDCPASFPTAPPVERAQKYREAQRLEPLGDACQHRTDYFAYHGSLLLNLNRPQEAAIALEKALLLAPELGGAQLDYAQALAELGQIAAARHLASDIASRPDLPPGLQTWLQSQIGDWQGSGWRTAWSLDLLSGHENNLNGSPDIRFLTLTLPGGNVELELEGKEGRQPGNTFKSDLLLAAAHPLGSGLIQLGAQHLNRSSHGLPATRQELNTLNLTYHHPLWNGQLGGRLEHTRIQIGNDPAYTGQNSSLLYQIAPTLTPEPCNLSLGGNSEQRNYPGARHQNGQYRGQLLHYGCRWDTWQINLSLQHGTDHARNPQRLGGDQQRNDLTLAIGHRIDNHRITLALSDTQARDATPYSPLLGNTPRQINRQTARLHWEYPLTPHCALISQLEHTRQTSNINLFGMNNQALYLGIRLHSQ
ncbi:MAG: hypothetical protein RLZZ220_610 [Pseudomonadota bacterium]